MNEIIGYIFSTFQARVWNDGAVQSTEGEIPRRDGYVLLLAREGYGAVLLKKCLQVGSGATRTCWRNALAGIWDFDNVC